MTDARERLPSRWPALVAGLLVLLAGLATAAVGAKLIMAGDADVYYAAAGGAFALAGLLLIAARSLALAVYGLVLMAATVWSVYAVGFDDRGLLWRLGPWAVLGLVALSGAVRRALAARGRRTGNGLATPTLLVAVLGVFATALAGQLLFLLPASVDDGTGRPPHAAAAPTTASGTADDGPPSPAPGALPDSWLLHVGVSHDPRQLVRLLDQDTSLDVAPPALPPGG